MNIARIHTVSTAATVALTRAARWLCLPLLLIAVVSAGHQTKTDDNHAVFSQFVVDLSAIDANPADGSDNPDHDAFTASGPAVVTVPALALQPQAVRAPAVTVAHAFAPRAPPVSANI
ncbi:hypothetical protein [Gilvimarinus japonicus]|jgi:hypothetical protein|uniref:Uncharacterized protein n=1 Tax=Gilvimarinus japonicus TaxID=1796469 RepID=A0ABV7HWX6_9GAMM